MKIKTRILPLVFFLFCAPAFSWSLDVKTDDMTGKVIQTLAVESTNSHTLSWPYGRISARLLLRNHPRYGKDILFIADNGQLMCHSYAPCKVLVRFDDKPPMTFMGTGPSDGDSTVAFLPGFDRFISALKGAKITKVEVEFYQNGRRVFEFDTSDLDASKISTRPDKPTQKR